jgi:two-component system sensor histidine kinase KdpD
MGIGVGLSVCNGIVRDHGGILTVANRPQGGARFTIQLPIQS